MKDPGVVPLNHSILWGGLSLVIGIGLVEANPTDNIVEVSLKSFGMYLTLRGVFGTMLETGVFIERR